MHILMLGIFHSHRSSHWTTVGSL